MANAIPQTVLNWLHSILINDYRDVNRTYSDVVYALQQHPTLKLKTDVYTFDHGASALLLNLQHTLPVTFRGTTYGFPISLWIPQEYPAASPIGFVVPTKDMIIRAGQHVGGDGRVYHPYLANWNAQKSNLIEVLRLLQQVFSHEPPLIARAQQNSRAFGPLQHQGTPPPVPPLPPKPGARNDDSFERRGQQFISEALDQAAPPPKPPKGDVRPVSKYDKPAPLPPETSMPRILSPSSQLGNGYVPGPHIAHQSSNQRPSEARRPYDDRPRASGNQWQMNTTYMADTPSFAATPQNLPYRGPPPSQSHQHLPQNFAPQSQPVPHHPAERQSFQSPQQSHKSFPPQQAQPPKSKPPPDLLTSLTDSVFSAPAPNVAPPPIPPNPQKDALLSAISQTLTQQVASAHSSTESAIPPLRAQQAALTSTLNSINREISQLDDVEALLSNNETILRQSMRDADKVLEEAKRRKVPSVDEVLVAPTVVAGQLYQAVAEQRAIEDCRNVLGKALDRGRIGGNVWAKQTRSLAREEFMKKALIKKISKGMGLAEEREWH